MTSESIMQNKISSAVSSWTDDCCHILSKRHQLATDVLLVEGMSCQLEITAKFDSHSACVARQEMVRWGFEQCLAWLEYAKVVLFLVDAIESSTHNFGSHWLLTSRLLPCTCALLNITGSARQCPSETLFRNLIQAAHLSKIEQPQREWTSLCEVNQHEAQHVSLFSNWLIDFLCFY